MGCVAYITRHGKYTGGGTTGCATDGDVRAVLAGPDLLPRRGRIVRRLIEELGFAATEAVAEPPLGGVVEEGSAVEEGDAVLGDGKEVLGERVEPAGGGEGGGGGEEGGEEAHGRGRREA